MTHLIKNMAKLLTVLGMATVLVACGGGGTSSNASQSSVTGSSNGASAAPSTATGIGAVTLNWMPPTANTNGSVLTNLAGYHIYYGTSPDKLTQMIALNNQGLTSYVVEGLTANTVYYFAITAVNSNNIQSGLSNVATKDVVI